MKITSTHFKEEYLPQMPHKQRRSNSLGKQPNEPTFTHLKIHTPMYSSKMTGNTSSDRRVTKVMKGKLTIIHLQSYLHGGIFSAF